jgi:hypothetical protein
MLYLLWEIFEQIEWESTNDRNLITTRLRQTIRATGSAKIAWLARRLEIENKFKPKKSKQV